MIYVPIIYQDILGQIANGNPDTSWQEWVLNIGTVLVGGLMMILYNNLLSKYNDLKLEINDVRIDVKEVKGDVKDVQKGFHKQEIVLAKICTKFKIDLD